MSQDFPIHTDLLLADPTVAWVREGLGLYGWGEELRFDPGVGSERFDRAREAVEKAPGGLGLATFTFDEDEPGSLVIIPQVLVEEGPGGRRALFGDPGRIPTPPEAIAPPSGRIVASTRNDWERTVAIAMESIWNGEIEKVVVSRTVDLEFGGEVPMARVASNLVATQGGSHTFMIDGLVGSSPELLISKHGEAIRSLSLAGSADGADPAAPAYLTTPKVTLEHGLAADSVEDALGPFCVSLSRQPSTVRSYTDIHHMSTAFEGMAKPGTRVTDLVAALHPTAAVAGTPTKAAVELIREVEPDGRGRYAGPVGWLDASGDGEFAIALRCGEVRGRRVTLYSGVGLVEGSDAGAEWEETEVKLRPMLRALGVS